MPAALDAITALLSALAFGAVMFVSFALAPLVFRVLEPPAAGRFLRAMFPRYYRVLVASGVGLSLLCLGRGGLVVPAAALAVLAAASLGLVPRINAAKDAGPSAAGRFRRLHGASVVLNLGMLAASGWLVVALAAA